MTSDTPMTPEPSPATPQSQSILEENRKFAIRNLEKSGLRIPPMTDDEAVAFLVENLERLQRWCRSMDRKATIWLHAKEAAAALQSLRKAIDGAEEFKRTIFPGANIHEQYVKGWSEAVDYINYRAEVMGNRARVDPKEARNG